MEMTKAELKRFRVLLEAKRHEVRNDIHSRVGGLQLDRGGDRMDEVRNMAERNATVEDAVRMSRLLEQVEDALERMDSGTFGVCLACGEKLPRKRLELVPWAAYCVSCQDLSERAQLDIAELRRPFREAMAS
jgi:DnaK suppressor protein